MSTQEAAAKERRAAYGLPETATDEEVKAARDKAAAKG